MQSRRLNLALLVDRQNHSMGRRVHIDADDFAHLCCELWVVRELEGAEAIWLRPMRAPDRLDVRKAHTCGRGYRPANEARRFARRSGQCQSDDPLGYLWAEGLNRERRDLSRNRLSRISSDLPCFTQWTISARVSGSSFNRYKSAVSITV